MKYYSHLLIFSLFLVSLVSVGQDLIPFENRGTGLWGFFIGNCRIPTRGNRFQSIGQQGEKETAEQKSELCYFGWQGQV